MAASAMRLYQQLAPWFHLLTAPADYAGEAAWMLASLRERSRRPVETLLELGSGGGNNASHLKRDLRLTLTDVSQAMLDVSAGLNPGVEHLLGDMRSLRLGRTFDAVLVHDAIMYATTEADLAATIRTAAAHLAPGGVAAFAPDCVRETFEPATSHGGHDGTDGRALRYVEWTQDPDADDTEYRVDFACLLREADGSLRAESDHQRFGLFARADWLRLIEAEGLAASCAIDDWSRDVFFGARAEG